MGDLDVNFEALDECRMEVSGQVGPLAAAGDGLPEGVTADAFGGLEGAGKFAEAVNGLSKTFGEEIDQGSNRLDQVAVALDAVITTLHDTEQNNAGSLTPAPK